MAKASELINFWDMALSHPLGIWLTSPDTVRLKDHLYQARAGAQREGRREYDALQIRTSPLDPRGSLWIVNPLPSLTNGAAP